MTSRLYIFWDGAANVKHAFHFADEGCCSLRPELPQVMVGVLVRRHAPLLEREPAKEGVNRPGAFARSCSARSRTIWPRLRASPLIAR